MEVDMPKRRYNYNELRIRPVVAGSIIAIVTVIVFFACYLRLSGTYSFYNLPDAATGGEPMSLSMIAAVCGVSSIVIMLVFGAYLYFCERQVFVGLKKLLIVCTLMTLSTALSALMTFVSGCFTAVMLAVILVGTLVNKRLAYSIVLVMSSIVGIMALNTAGSGIHNGSISIMISLALGGFATVFALNLKHGRSIPIIAGVAGGAVSAVAFMCVQAIDYIRFSDMLVPSIWLFASCLLCGIISTGLMPVFENLFDISTDARLNELMNNNNSLLKRLMIEAPGTYHHSMLVGTLAESAAEAIGANPILCKAAGYYHDVGKLRSPIHFRENQRDYNIHDDLPPLESAQRIIAHQKDGVTLLTKHKLPADVIRIAAEHHGDSLVVFFYGKAIQEAGAKKRVDESEYRYCAPKPSTKESGIIMLADCCEAAVRSIKQPTQELIEAKVRDVIGNIWLKQNGALSEAPLTAKDISLIERCFINALSAQYHERIEYPDLEDVENAK